MKTVWVFGASRSIGKAVVERCLRNGERVLAWSRSGLLVQNNRRLLFNEEIDLADVGRTRARIQMWLAEWPPDAAVFCQRYRHDAGLDELGAARTGIDVEAGPALELAKLSGANMIFLSSVAGKCFRPDQSVSYHMRKAAVIAASRVLKANCLIIGELVKYPLESYTDAEVEKFARADRVVTTQDVARIIEMIIGGNIRNTVFEL